MRTKTYRAERPYPNGDANRMDVTFNERDLRQLTIDLLAIEDIEKYPTLFALKKDLGFHVHHGLRFDYDTRPNVKRHLVNGVELK